MTASKSGSALDLTVADLESRVAEATGLITKLESLFIGLTPMTTEERASSSGKLRDEEPVAMTSILDTVQGNPHHFTALAAKDGGVDAKAVETQPARDDLARRNVLAPLAKRLAFVSDGISDGVLDLGDRARDFTGPAYAIAKTVAPHDDAVKRTLAPATDFYASIARRRTPKKD